jgi:hypothetical protein
VGLGATSLLLLLLLGMLIFASTIVHCDDRTSCATPHRA